MDIKKVRIGLPVRIGPRYLIISGVHLALSTGTEGIINSINTNFEYKKVPRYTVEHGKRKKIFITKKFPINVTVNVILVDGTERTVSLFDIEPKVINNNRTNG